MTKNLSILILVMTLLAGNGFGQNRVEVFADVQGNDTLQKLLNIFSTQLKRAGSYDISIRPTAQFTGRGIYVGFSRGKNTGVRPPAKLLQAGVEAFSAESAENSIRILGNSNMALGHGLFSYLDLIGFRFYFPNKEWHIIPQHPNLFPKWNMVSTPSFDHRRIWYGYGTGSKIADEDYDFWFLANRQGGSINAYFGHAYEDFIARNKDVFLQHPEWFYPVAPRGTIPANDPKFDMTQESLIQFIIQDIEKRIQTSLKNGTTDYKMFSLGPSDGLGTCNTPACQKLGTITDRVYYLVNRVAKAIRQKYPSTYIGCLAYGEYSPPPTKNVEPNVFVGITTAFNASKLSVPQLVDAWRKKGAFVGIYDYFSWFAWDFDLPGLSLASRSNDIVASIKNYYNKGVRAYEGESSIGWISKGLGYYLAAKTMWDAKTDIEPLKKEFFQLCFGKAAEPMRSLWNSWEKYSFSFVRENELAKWIDLSEQAWRMETSSAIRARLFQVRSYLHYLSLYHDYENDKTERTLLPLLNYGYRKLDDGSVPGYPAFFELGNRSGLPGMGWVENAKWRHNNSPVTVEEINRVMIEDRRKLKVTEPVKLITGTTKFKNVPDFKKFGHLMKDSATGDNAIWLVNEFVMEIKKKGEHNFINITGDYVGDKTVTKPIKLTFYRYDPNGDVFNQQPILYYEYNSTMVKEKISLAKFEPGYYTIITEDPAKIFRFTFSQPVNYSLVMRPGRQLSTPAFFYSFLYVPEGVTKFTIVKGGALDMVTPTGRVVNTIKDKLEDTQIPVLKGEAGLWRIKLVTGKFYAEGIPPFVGLSPSQMLIPADVK